MISQTRGGAKFDLIDNETTNLSISSMAACLSASSLESYEAKMRLKTRDSDQRGTKYLSRDLRTYGAQGYNNTFEELSGLYRLALVGAPFLTKPIKKFH